MFKRFMISAVVATAACAAAAGAQAGDIHLKFSDLDLTQPAQAHVLDSRITQGAKFWCADQITTGTRLPSPSCEREARAALIEALPAPAQRAYRSGMAAPPAMAQAQASAPQAAVR